MEEGIKEQLIKKMFDATVLCLARTMRDEAAKQGEPNADVSKFIRPAVEEIDFYFAGIFELQHECAVARSLRS